MDMKLLFCCIAALLFTVSVAIDYSKFKIGDTVHQVVDDGCGDICAFRFCKADGQRSVVESKKNKPRIITLRDAGIASNPFICARLSDSNKLVQVKVKKSGQAKVLKFKEETKFTPISKYLKGTVTSSFSKKYFFLKGITERPSIPGEIGIARLTSMGNQEQFLDDLCVNLPIKSYDVLNKKGRVVNSVSKSKKKEDCIAFRTTVPIILIELTWQNADDIDVRVNEPDGNLIAYFDLQSAKTGGKLNLDQNVARCGEDSTGREQIKWNVRNEKRPLDGEYKIQVRHFSTCRDGPTRWNLAVVVNGKLVVRKTGVSKLRGGDQIIDTASFNYKA